MTAMHRTLLKWFACCALGLLMLPARAYKVDMLPPPDPDDGLTFRVLCMHDVRDNLRASFADMPDQFAIETRTLTDLFEWIRVKGFNLISMQQIIDSRAGVRPLPPRPILLTFDDGYASTYTKVFPLLKKFNYPAVVAVVTSWTDAPAGTKIRLSPKIEVPHDFFMTWAQLREMAQSGLVELASHSHNLHRGVLANPQGNEQPAASSRQYLPASGRYENDAEYRARVRQDLKTSADLIREHTGVTIRSIVWPYGAHNRDTDQVAAEVGLNIGLTLQPGPNTPDVSLTQIRRSLVDYEVNVATVARAMREPVSYHGQVRPIERIVQVDLDYIYDPDPEQQNRNLGQLIDRMKDLAPSAVYLQAFAYPKGDGDITEVYFPNRHLPMRADLFNRVAWQLKTRAGVMVYAWLPVLTFSVPPATRPMARWCSRRPASPASAAWAARPGSALSIPTPTASSARSTKTWPRRPTSTACCSTTTPCSTTPRTAAPRRWPPTRAGACRPISRRYAPTPSWPSNGPRARSAT
ncbi:hemin storage protein [Bordetella pertussis]|nr:hemin storage protein [Bordetella pertussis]